MYEPVRTMHSPVPRPANTKVAHREAVDPQQIQHHRPLVVVVFGGPFQVPVVAVRVQRAAPLEHDVLELRPFRTVIYSGVYLGACVGCFGVR